MYVCMCVFCRDKEHKQDDDVSSWLSKTTCASLGFYKSLFQAVRRLDVSCETMEIRLYEEAMCMNEYIAFEIIMWFHRCVEEKEEEQNGMERMCSLT